MNRRVWCANTAALDAEVAPRCSSGPWSGCQPLGAGLRPHPEGGAHDRRPGGRRAGIVHGGDRRGDRLPLARPRVRGDDDSKKLRIEYYIQMKRVILSGGGTGGHIYPAVAVAEALATPLRRRGGTALRRRRRQNGDGEDSGAGLPHRRVCRSAGLQRRFATVAIWRCPSRYSKASGRARRTIREFGADVVVGFGGYASGPGAVGRAADRESRRVIQEQNSYAGLTNKILARGARRICVAYDGMERFFPAERIVHTGNPLRGRFAVPTEADRLEGAAAFGLDAARPTVLVVGGSLGCRTLNETMKAWLARQEFRPPFQVIWQTGKYYEARDAALSGRTSRAGASGRELSSTAWTTPMPRPTWSCRAAAPARSRSCAWWPSPCCSSPRPTWPKITRPRTRRRSSTGRLPVLVARRRSARTRPMATGGWSCSPTPHGGRCAMSRNLAALAVPDAAERIVDEIEKIW